MNNLLIYLSIYLLPMALIMAGCAPDLDVVRMQFVDATARPVRRVWVGLWLTLGNIGINVFLSTTLEPQQLLIAVAWQIAYMWFAIKVGPWL